MKLLFTSLIVLMCSCVSAVAQTEASGTVKATVTSTIRVRIPDFASVMLQENRTTSVAATVSGKQASGITHTRPLELRANQPWILHTERLARKISPYSNPTRSPGPETVYLIHTATPE